MSITVKNIVEYLTTFAPVETAESWDNCGLLVGGGKQDVTSVMVALDITPSVVKQAQAIGANLIISHHPVIFRPMARLSASSVPYLLAQNGMSACCMHTCLDKATGGVNDALCARLGLRDVVVGTDEFTRVGTLENAMSAEEFIDLAENALQTKVRFHGKKEIKTVAVVGGGGGEFIAATLEGRNGTPVPDAFITGEIKHNIWLEMADYDQLIIEAGHFSTEHPVVDTLIEQLSKKFPSVCFVKAEEIAPYSTK